MDVIWQIIHYNNYYQIQYIYKSFSLTLNSLRRIALPPGYKSGARLTYATPWKKTWFSSSYKLKQLMWSSYKPTWKHLTTVMYNYVWCMCIVFWVTGGVEKWYTGTAKLSFPIIVNIHGKVVSNAEGLPNNGGKSKYTGRDNSITYRENIRDFTATRLKIELFNESSV